MRLLIAATFVYATLLLTFHSTLAADDAKGFRTSLFNGQDLQGWKAITCDVTVEGGNLVLTGGDGMLRSEHRYRDFILELEYKPRKTEMYDSGIYIRAEEPAEGKKFPDRFQINLKQGDELNLIRFPKARSTGLVKPGEWNKVKLTVRGDQAQMEINGQAAWKTDGLEVKDGYVGLQVEVPLGGQFEFRNLFITELDHVAMFNGKDLTGWEGAGQPASACWQVEDGLLMCTGAKGPWLRSLEQYGDFNLRLEYKLKEGGNSGVYVRVPKDGNHHGKDAGVEIQVLDDQSPRYKKLEPYQYTGSVYKVAPSKDHVGRAAGQWNSLEIDCQGPRYRITHNGTLIVDADVEEFPGLKERLTKGYLGLQNHSEEVWYRNVRIHGRDAK
jgi:hypothetical protein